MPDPTDATDPPAPVPDDPAAPLRDDKDWTWVLDRACPDCGLHAGDVPLEEVPARLRAAARDLAGLLDDPQATTRPAPTTWSALEYACHVRDCCDLYDTRLQLMLTEDDPLFANWDQDETALAERYHAQDPTLVAAQVVTAADTLAHAFAAVVGDQWDRTGRRSDGADFTVASFARYFLHDPVHHLWDAQQGLDRTAD